MASPQPIPSGCRHCGLDRRLHFSRWTDEARWHGLTEPTRDQIADRMRAKLANRTTDTEASTS